MTKQLPPPRTVPQQVGFSVPHAELFRACRVFWADLERAEAEGRADINALQTNLGVSVTYQETWQVEVYASTVHLFAALTAEAAIATYAVVRFGDQAFQKHFRFLNPIHVRLRAVLHHKPGLDLSDSSEIVMIIRRLFAIRNALVHAQSGEDGSDDAARVRELDHLTVSKRSAAQAMADVVRFLAVLSSFDEEVAPFLLVW
jgi:hypothetical protein